MTDVKTAMIVAMAENGVIGRNNQLPWYLPEDLRYFKQVTMGKPIIMGRKTFESIGKPLPGRANIIISRSADYQVPEGVRLVTNVDEAIKLAKDIAFIDAVDEIMVIGGEQIYTSAAVKADRLYLTKVHADVDGDAYFTVFDEKNWSLQKEEKYSASENNPYDYSFCVYEKIA